MAEAVTVTGPGLRSMITLCGDPTLLAAVCSDLTGAAFPATGRVEMAGEAGLAWMSPDEVLILLPHPQVPAAMTRIQAALAGQHHLAVDVSDARASFTLRGPFARDVIAKLAPVDMHPAGFAPGDFRRSRLGQVAAAFWMTADQSIHVVCFRSVADYVQALLQQSAADGPVGAY